MRSTQRTGPGARISWYLLRMGPMRGIVLVCLVATTSGAAAQAPRSGGAQISTARRAVSEGNFELAFSTYLQLARRSDDPVVHLELAEIAERLRREQPAITAYRRYLELRPRTERHEQLRARIELLEGFARGRRERRGEDIEGTSTAREPRCESGPVGADVLLNWAGDALYSSRTSAPPQAGGRAEAAEEEPPPRQRARPPRGLGQRLDRP